MLGRLQVPLLVLVTLLVLTPLALATHEDAGSTDNANPDTWMEGDYRLDLGEDLTTLTVTGTLGLHKMRESGTLVTADDVRTAYNAQPDAAARDAYLQPFRSDLKGTLDATFSDMFPGRPIEYLLMPTEDLATLTPSATGPVRFDLSLRVTLEASNEGLGAYASEQIEAVLQSGAAVRTVRVFSAAPGHDNTYTLAPPAFAAFTAGTSPDPAYVPTLAAGAATVRVDAADRTSPLTSAPVTLTLRDPTQTPPTTERVTIVSDIRMGAFERYANGTCCVPGLPLTVGVTIELGAVSVADTLGSLASSIPDAVTLPTHLSADALRLLRSVGILEASHIAQAESTLNSRVKSDLDRSLKANVTLTPLDGGLAASLATGGVSQPLDGTPAVTYAAVSSPIKYDMGTDSNTADAGFLAGAIVSFNMTFEEGADRQQVYRITLPSTLAFMNATTPVRGATLTFAVPDAQKRLDVALQIGDPAVRRATREVVRNAVTVSLRDMEGIQTETVPVDLRASAEVDSLEVAGRFPTALPSNVRIPFLTAEGLRILYARGVITAADIAKADADLLEEMNATLSSAFPGGVTTTGGFVAASLAADAPALAPAVYNATAVALHDLGAKADHADAALDAGALVNATFTLTGKARQVTTYTLVLPPGAVRFVSNAPVGPSFTTTLDNANGPTDVEQEVTLRFGKDMPRPTRADTRVSLALQMERFRDGVDGLPLSAEIAASLHAMEVADRFPDALPEEVELKFLTSDGFRILYQRGVIKDSDLANATENFTKELRQRLNGTFGGSARVTGSFDRASLTAANGTPVRIVASASMVRGIGSATPKQAEVILDAGARVGVTADLKGFDGAEVTYTLRAPEGLAFRNASGMTVLDPRTLQLRLDGRGLATDPNQTVRFKLHNPDAIVYTKQDSSIQITIDMKLNLELVKAAQTRDGDMELDLDAAVNLGVVEIPESLRSKLPAEVEITHIPVDALRRLWQAGALNESQVSKLETEFLSRVADGLKGVAGGPVAVTGGIARSDLEKPVTGPLKGDDPLKLTASATLHKSLRGGASSASALDQARITLLEMPLSLPLQSFQGLPTTYTVILPTGLEFAKADAGAGAPVTTGTTDDGRDYMTVTVASGKTATAAMSIAVTPMLLVDQFLPWLIGLGLLLVALVALPILGVVRLVRRRKARKAGKGGA